MIKALFRPKPSISKIELKRLQAVERLAKVMVEKLEDGKVDYDLLAQLKALIDG